VPRAYSLVASSSQSAEDDVVFHDAEESYVEAVGEEEVTSKEVEYGDEDEDVLTDVHGANDAPGSPDRESESGSERVVVDDEEAELGPSPVEIAKADSDVEDKELSEENKSVENFITGATWEERAWKELVRLREDMFWARLGGLR